MHLTEGAEALGLLAEAVQAGTAALASHQMRLDLGAAPGIELAVQVAAEGQQAALHSAISR
jgi:hypothetical protein